MPALEATEEELQHARAWITKYGVGLTLLLIVVWPLASVPAGVLLGAWCWGREGLDSVNAKIECEISTVRQCRVGQNTGLRGVLICFLNGPTTMSPGVFTKGYFTFWVRNLVAQWFGVTRILFFETDIRTRVSKTGCELSRPLTNKCSSFPGGGVKRVNKCV